MSREAIEKWQRVASNLSTVLASFSPPARAILGGGVDVSRARNYHRRMMWRFGSRMVCKPRKRTIC
jgi:hypothetical protein